MDFVNFVMALSPILVVLVGILGFKQSAKRVSPIALVWTLILAFTYFNVTGASFADNVKTLDCRTQMMPSYGFGSHMSSLTSALGEWTSTLDTPLAEADGTPVSFPNN